MLSLSCPVGSSVAERIFVSSCSWLAPSRTSERKSSRTRSEVRTPTAIANASRMTSVRTAEQPARRHRKGMRATRSLIGLGAEHVPRAADRVEQSGLAAGLELATQVRDEHLDRVRGGEGVVA